jgi:Phosphatidylinositol-specific phospholipase C, X domain
VYLPFNRESQTSSPQIIAYRLYLLIQLLCAALQGLSARAPARCVEIDAWYTSAKGPIVTHGHTFTGSIPFKDVCQAINEVVVPNDPPVFISLECHVDVDKQPELVKIMEDVWGDKLLREKLQHLGDRKVSPNDLRGRIVMMVCFFSCVVSCLTHVLGGMVPLSWPGSHRCYQAQRSRLRVLQLRFRGLGQRRDKGDENIPSNSQEQQG